MPWIDKVHSSFPDEARGTAIMMKKISIPFVHKSTIADRGGD